MKNKNPENNKKNSGSGRWWWLLVPVVAGMGIGIVILFGYSPSAYAPTQPENPRQVSVYLTHQLGPDFVNQVQLDQPFALVIEQAGLNDIISRWPWPQQLGELAFSDPVVMFSGESIILMGQLKYKDIASVISMQAMPVMNDAGDICLNIQSIRLGMLPVTPFIATLARKAFEDNASLFEGEPDLQTTVDAVLRNDYFDPTFWFFDRRVHVTDFSLQPGMLHLTLTPKQDE
jgi:hypothetical protein